MTYICPHCGAVDTGSGTCKEMFESFLALEFTDPAYGEVHFLTVGTYIIQHNHYSCDSFRWICKNLRAFLKGTLTIQQIRDDVKNLEEKNIDKPIILSSPEDPPQKQILWRMTIADVAEQYGGAADYCALIRQWAEMTLSQIC